MNQLTVYIDGIPILSRDSIQTERACSWCGKDLTNSAMIHTVGDGKKPFQQVEICISCMQGRTNKNQIEKDDE